MSIFLIPISKLQHAPLPPKCYEPRTCLDSFARVNLHLSLLKSLGTSQRQFDSQPLKVGITLIHLRVGGRATYRWKDFNKCYNFSSNLTSIRSLNKKLWTSKMARVPISGLPTWDAAPMTNHI